MSNSAWKQRLPLWKCCSPSFLADSLGPAWVACQSLPTQIIPKLQSFVVLLSVECWEGSLVAGQVLPLLLTTDSLDGLLTVFTARFPMRANTSGSARLTAPPSPGRLLAGCPGDLQWRGVSWGGFGVRECYCNLSECRNYDRVFVRAGFYLW